MSVDTVPPRVEPPSGAPAPSRPGRRYGLYRLVLRQNRLLGWSGLALLALLAGWTVREHHTTSAAGRALAQASCPGGVNVNVHAATDACLNALQRSSDATGSAQHLQLALLAVPLLIGVFVGAPLLGQEFEHGTHRLMWTQSVSRHRWLTAKLAVPAAGVLLLGALLSVLGAWLCTGGRSALMPWTWNRFDALVYNTVGPVPVAAALLALALGVLAGALLRRTVPAMAATAVVYAAVAAGLDWLRRYLQPVHTLVHFGGYNLPPDSWLLKDGVVMPDGRRLTYAQCGPPGCGSGHTTFEQYHTAAQFWPMQWAETGLMLLVAAVAVAASYRLLRRDTL